MASNMPSSISDLLSMLGQTIGQNNAASLVSPIVAQQVATSPAATPNVPVPTPTQSPQQSLQQALAGQLYQPTQGGQPAPQGQYVEPPPPPSAFVAQPQSQTPASGGQYGSNWASPSQVQEGWGQVAASGGSPQAAPQQGTSSIFNQPSWQKTPAQQPALGGQVIGGGNVITAPAQGTGQVLNQQFPGNQNRATAQLPQGMIQPGNINLYQRPQVKNPDGTVSTVRSISIGLPNGKSALIPTVAADGSGVLTNDQAVQQFRQTGQHLGIFDSDDDADAYAQTLHQQQDQLYNPNLQGQQ